MLLSLSTPMVHLLSQQIALAVDVSGYRTGLLRNFLEFPFLLLPWEQDLLKPPLASMNCSSLEWWILNRHGWSVPTSFQLCYPAYPVIQLSTAWYLSSTRCNTVTC
ncbi:hypothetical protein RLOC_00009835 [Lonchura striata]|uniref:Uncharacterized protein n=1 Tax=Lonchura striata TaxID=40157 RepID=A0A218UC23_9PASE|nr:hypothetical protein RLOC_00009835 [Lonchura striata domestica]